MKPIEYLYINCGNCCSGSKTDAEGEENEENEEYGEEEDDEDVTFAEKWSA